MKTTIRHIISLLLCMTVLSITAQEHQVIVRASECGAAQTYSLPNGAALILKATPAEDSRFVAWSDGNTDNPRTVTVTEDVAFTAVFAHNGDISSSDKYKATVYAGNCTNPFVGEFNQGALLKIVAEPKAGYQFKQWSDGNTDNPRVLTITSDIELRAEYEEYVSHETLYNVTVNADGCGTSFSRQFYGGTKLVLNAHPDEGSAFVRWQDGNTDNPRNVTVTKDIIYTAVFEPVIICGTIETTDGITVWEDELPYTWEDKIFTEAGTQTTTLKSMDGCDSIVTFTLRVRYNNIVLQENESSEYYDLFAEDYNGYTVTTATLNRQFTQGKWATLCLPFNVSKGMMMALGLNARVYEFRYAETVDNLTVIYFAVAQSIEAGKGYIVNANAKLAQKESFVFPNVTINTDADNADITALTGYNDNSGRGSIYLVGTLRTGKLQGTTNGNIYLGLKDNMLYYPNTVTGTNIRAYRGFFRSEVPLNAQCIRIVADGEEFTIDNGELIIENSSAVKYIENGILYIRSNGKTYNAQGQRLD